MRRTMPVILFLVCIFPVLSFADELLQVPASVQIASTISDGKHSIAEIARIAHDSGARIVVFADRDYMQWEYGLWPLRNIIKRLVKSNSLAAYGIQKYLKEIEDAQRENPDLILIPGVECAPFYYWEGSLFKNNLTIKNWHKHMLIVGLEKTDDYRNIPSIANKISLKLPFSLKYLFLFWPIAGIGVGIICLRKRRFAYKDAKGHNLGPYSHGWRALGTTSIILSLLFLLNTITFRSLLYDQYHGDRGITPYQNLIDYVKKRGGLIFWVHPEAEYIQARGNIAIETKEYSQDLYKSRGYNGFSIFYDGYHKVGSPSGVWDDVLKEYCLGRRTEPVWAIGSLGFDQGGSLDKEVKNLRVIFLLPALNRRAVVKAMGEGKLYVVMGGDSLRLENFSVQDSLDSAQKAISGEALIVKGKPNVKISGYMGSAADEDVKIKLIKNGGIIKMFEVKSPFQVEYTDDFSPKGEGAYYRLEITSGNSILVTNPIFVRSVRNYSVPERI